MMALAVSLRAGRPPDTPIPTISLCFSIRASTSSAVLSKLWTSRAFSNSRNFANAHLPCEGITSRRLQLHPRLAGPDPLPLVVAPEEPDGREAVRVLGDQEGELLVGELEARLRADALEAVGAVLDDGGQANGVVHDRGSY